MSLASLHQRSTNMGILSEKNRCNRIKIYRINGEKVDVFGCYDENTPIGIYNYYEVDSEKGYLGSFRKLPTKIFIARLLKSEKLVRYFIDRRNEMWAKNKCPCWWC